MKKVFGIFFIWRILLFFPLLIGRYFLPYRQGYEYTNLWFYIKSYSPVRSYFLYPWANFDGIHYLNIAGNGYTSNARFFPLYPILIRFYSNLFGAQHAFDLIYFFTGLFLANLLFLLSLFLIYCLLKKKYSEKIVLKTIVFILLFPTAFFFVSIYSESLFLFLAVLTFYWIQKKNWLFATLSTILLSLTRLVGVCMIPVLVYSFFTHERKYEKGVPILLSPVGLLYYIWFNVKTWGNPFHFLSTQGELLNGRSVNKIILIPQTMIRYFKIFFTVSPRQYDLWVAIFKFIVFLFGCVGLYLVWKKKIDYSYIFFGILCFLVPTLSGTFTGLPRYVSIIFPIFIALALIKNKYLIFLYIFISSTLLILCLVAFSRGYYIS
jgi:hypothetical protein